MVRGSRLIACKGLLQMSINGRVCAVSVIAEGYIRIYRFVDNGRQLELVHRTAVGGIPGALAPFKVCRAARET